MKDEKKKVILLFENNEFEINNYDSFIDAAFSGKRSNYLTPYTKEEYKEYIDTYKLKDYDIGYGIKSDGDIVSIFNNSNVRDIGKYLLQSAINNGGYKLDHYEGWLSTLYEPLGFIEYNRYKWNEDYSPENWNYETDGYPDVVMRQYNYQ